MIRPRPARSLITGWLLLVLSLTACAPYQPKVDVEHDPSTDLSQFDSYNFISPLALDEAGYPETVSDEFQAVIGRALEARGYVRSEEPDLLINVAARLSGEGDQQLRSDAYQAIHSQSAGGGTFHESWRGYGHGYGASTQQSRYGEGTINIGIIRREDLQMVWEGIASGRLSGTRSEASWRELIESVTGEMFAGFPESAGND